MWWTQHRWDIMVVFCPLLHCGLWTMPLCALGCRCGDCNQFFTCEWPCLTSASPGEWLHHADACIVWCSSHPAMVFWWQAYGQNRNPSVLMPWCWMYFCVHLCLLQHVIAMCIVLEFSNWSRLELAEFLLSMVPKGIDLPKCLQIMFWEDNCPWTVWGAIWMESALDTIWFGVLLINLSRIVHSPYSAKLAAWVHILLQKGRHSSCFLSPL